MRVVLVGLNPKAAPGALWRRAAFSPKEAPLLARDFCRMPDVHGAAVLAGEGRAECYLVLDQGRDAFELVADCFAQRAQVPASDCAPFLYMAEGLDAAGHLFHVACGLDSFAANGLPCAEALRAARDSARVAGADRAAGQNAAGALLGELLDRAVRLAGRAESLAGANEDSFALAEAALGVARRAFDDLGKCEVLLLGDGRVCELAARRLMGEGACRFVVACSAAERATDVARPLKGVVRRLEDAEECLSRADIALSSAEDLFLGAHLLRRVRRARRGRMLLAFDFAQSQGLSAALSGADDAFVYQAADLERLAADLAPREPAAPDSLLDLAGAELAAFTQWLEGQGR